MYSAPAAPFLLRKREKPARKELKVVIRLVRGELGAVAAVERAEV
jgi:hypothetical protein